MSINPSSRIVKKEMRRQQISQKAMSLFEKYSFEEVTIADICEACNISVGSFYHLFGSKENTLFLALAVRRDRYISEHFKLDENEDFFTQFYNCVMVNIRHNYSVKKDFLGATYAAYVTQKAAQNLLPGRTYVDTLMGVIRHGIRCSAFTLDMTERELFHFFNAMIIGIAVDWCARDQLDENELCETFASQVVRLAIRREFVPQELRLPKA